MSVIFSEDGKFGFDFGYDDEGNHLVGWAGNVARIPRADVDGKPVFQSAPVVAKQQAAPTQAPKPASKPAAPAGKKA